MKKSILSISLAIVSIILILVIATSFSYNIKEQDILVLQFGKVVDVKTEPGIFFKAPFIQSLKKIYTGERIYDVPASEVITSDKKTMIANCYVTWEISDSRKYYQSLSSESVAQSRIDVAVYNSMKNVISSTLQTDVINGKDGSLGANILKRIDLEEYGITITEVEMKLLDLPSDNKQAVYNRMISEREAIAAEYKANGEKESKNIRSAADAKVRETISNAQVVAADTEAEGEKEYFKILAEAYGASPERKQFYDFIVGLEAMKTSLSNGGTIVIDENSPIYGILNQK